MNRNILHTPDGVRDIYEKECARKLSLESGIRSVLNSYGYRDIETPTFEFFDVFGSDIGTIPSRQLYKFFDREGNTLVLRPDFTPSIARACAKYFMDRSTPVRLCYQGNTFVNGFSYQGRLTENTQMGAELIGDGSVDADAELISMVIDAIRKTGLSEFQISLGNVQYFKALLKMASLSEREEEELSELIRNKNSFGVEKMLSSRSISEQLKNVFSALPMMTGGAEILEKAVNAAPCEEAAEAVSRLKQVYDILSISGLERYVSFDLGMMSNYMYYTGIIFRGYTYGTGEAIVKGGRYDDLLAHFGKEAPSVGFVVVIDQLMNALLRQKAEKYEPVDMLRILYNAKDRQEAISTARSLREGGTKVELMLVSDEHQEKQLMQQAKQMQMKVLRIGGSV